MYHIDALRYSAVLSSPRGTIYDGIYLYKGAVTV